jgi:hypothetical protein
VVDSGALSQTSPESAELDSGASLVGRGQIAGIYDNMYPSFLDRCIFHQDLNLPAKLANLPKDHGDDVLKAKRPGVSARVGPEIWIMVGR